MLFRAATAAATFGKASHKYIKTSVEVSKGVFPWHDSFRSGARGMEEDAYHRKMAYMTNIRARQDLDRLSKHYDKLKGEAQSVHTREEREVRRTLRRLSMEQEESKKELQEVKNYVKDMKKAEKDGSMKSRKSARKGIKKILQRSKMAPVETDMVNTGASAESAHEVAVRMLIEDNLGGKKQRRERRVTIAAHNQDQTDGASVSENRKSLKRNSLPQNLKIGNNQMAAITEVSALNSPGSLKRHSTPNAKIAEGMTEAQRGQEDNLRRESLRLPSIVDADSSHSSLGEEGSELGSLPEEQESSGGARYPIAAHSRRVSEPAPPVPRRHSMHVPRRASLAGTSDLDLYRKKAASMSSAKLNLEPKVSEERHMDVDTLKNYYAMINDSDPNLRIKGHDSGHSGTDKYSSSHTMQRSQRHKVKALEALLQQMPSFKQRAQVTMTSQDALNCRYLRLTRDTIEELETLSLLEGKDPGIHAHMTQDQVLEYFRNHQEPSEKDSVSTIEC